VTARGDVGERDAPLGPGLAVRVHHDRRRQPRGLRTNGRNLVDSCTIRDDDHAAVVQKIEDLPGRKGRVDGRDSSCRLHCQILTHHSGRCSSRDDESHRLTGGVTQGLNRCFVLPLTGTLADTDHVLGHELVHAFSTTRRGPMTTTSRVACH